MLIFEAKQKKVTAMMALKKIWTNSRKGQSLLEYAMVAALVSAAVIAFAAAAVLPRVTSQITSPLAAKFAPTLQATIKSMYGADVRVVNA